VYSSLDEKVTHRFNHYIGAYSGDFIENKAKSSQNILPNILKKLPFIENITHNMTTY